MYQFLSIPIGMELFLILLGLNKLSNFHENLKLILYTKYYTISECNLLNTDYIPLKTLWIHSISTGEANLFHIALFCCAFLNIYN